VGLSRDWLKQEGGADIPDLDSLQTDACAPEYHYHPVSQKLVLESKEHMAKVRKVRSPDEWDAIALTFAEPVTSNRETQPRSPAPAGPERGCDETVAGGFLETTVAAPQLPILRASVNADPCPCPKHALTAAKVGNATLEIMR
jgi:hypothetical protein